MLCHREERNDEAISGNCIAALAMTEKSQWHVICIRSRLGGLGVIL